MSLVITLTIFSFISCDINFLPFNKYSGNNFFSAYGVVRGSSFDFSTNQASLEYPDPLTPGRLSIRSYLGISGDFIAIRFNIDFITAQTSYTDTDIDESSPIHFQIESNIILESEGYHESNTVTGSLEIFDFDGDILTGTYNIVSDIGDTLSGEFRVHIPNQ